MKHLLALFLLLVPSLARADWIPFGSVVPRTPSVTIARSNGRTLDLDLEFPGVVAVPIDVQGRRMDHWTLPGETSLRNPGHPEVPLLTRLLALAGPDASVEVLSVAERVLPLTLAPAPSLPCRCGPGKAEYRTDERVYGSGAGFPGQWVWLDSVGLFRDRVVGRLVVAPVRFFPARSEARVATRLSLRVRLGTPVPHASPDRDSPSFDAVYRMSVLNAPKAFGTGSHAVERILVVVADPLKEAIQPWVDHRRDQGMPVEVATMSSVGKTADDVRKRIMTAYLSNVGVSYVLLVGDSDLVPHFYGADGCASDWMYTTLSGDDLYSDILVSRISATTPDEVAIQVEKVIEYEKNPPTGADASWIPAATVISSSEGEGTSNDDIRCDLIADLFETKGYAPVDRFYNSQGDDTAANISASLDAGRGMIAYLGHGSGLDWSTTSPPFSVEHIQALHNPWRLPVVIDVSCLNGEFDTLGDCMAEAWLKAGTAGAPTGAVASYSSSTETAWDEPAEMAVGFVHAMFDQGLRRWGEACLASRTWLIQKMGSGENIELVFQQYVQFGDATLLMRTKVPQTLVVSTPPIVPVGTYELVIAVTDGIAPVADALVALHKEGEFDRAAYTGTNGTVKFALATQAPGSIGIVVTAADFVPVTATVQAAVTGCAVAQAAPSMARCDGSVTFTAWDRDLDLDSGALETALASVVASPGKSLELTLTETAADSGAFSATVPMESLGTVHGSVVTFSLSDADCEGAPKSVSAVVTADCQAPAISNVTVDDVTAISAQIRFDTDEIASVSVTFGTTAPPSQVVEAAKPGKSHVVLLAGLVPSTSYVFRVAAIDLLGYVTTDDNGGAGYGFTTPACSPACSGKACGDDGCGGSCGTCELDQTCEGGICTGGTGCTVLSGPGWPGAKCETCVCEADVYCCSIQWDDLCVEMCESLCGGCGKCVPDCAGKACGNDGCGGSCGTCVDPCSGLPDADLCDASGACATPCCPACGAKACGPNGCGGNCGLCVHPCTGLPDPGLCEDGKCLAPCCPACDGKQCGDNGCGGTCGACLDPCSGIEDATLCQGGTCTKTCCPKCGGRECGDDGCGGSCGTCGEGRTCGAGWKCVGLPVPDPGPDPEPGPDPDPEPDVLEPVPDAGPANPRSTGGCSAGVGPAPVLWILSVLGIGLARIRR